MRKKLEELDGIERLRSAVAVFSHCNETFNQQFTTEQLLELWCMFYLCGWDITPDHWSPRQLEEALAGVVPRWDNNERAVYTEGSFPWDPSMTTCREITEADVGEPLFVAFGRTWRTADFIGWIMPPDVGKRVFLRGGILQVENNEQRDRRLAGPQSEEP